MKIKCVAIERSNLTNLAKSIEEFQNKHNLVSKGSIPFNFPDGNVGVIMFYPASDIKLAGQVGEKPLSPNKNSSPKAPLTKKEKFKTPEKWKSEEPTLKQRNALKKMNYSWEEINVFSKYDASKRIGGEKC